MVVLWFKPTVLRVVASIILFKPKLYSGPISMSTKLNIHVAPSCSEFKRVAGSLCWLNDATAVNVLYFFVLYQFGVEGDYKSLCYQFGSISLLEFII